MPTKYSQRSYRFMWLLTVSMFLVGTVAFLIGFWTLSGEWLFCSAIWLSGGGFCWWLIHDE